MEGRSLQIVMIDRKLSYKNEVNLIFLIENNSRGVGETKAHNLGFGEPTDARMYRVDELVIQTFLISF
jgi:hypothetical protein